MESTSGIDIPLVRVMKFCGLWYDFSDRKYGGALKAFNILRILFEMVVWTAQVVHLCREGASYLLKETALFIPLGCISWTSTFILSLNLKTIEEIVHFYKRRFDSYSDVPWAKAIIDEELERFNKMFQIPILSLLGFIVVYGVVPVSMDFIRAALGMEPYVLPLPMNFLLDEPPTRNTVYYTAMFLSYLYFFVIVVRYIAFEATMFYFVLFIVIDVKILKRKLEDLSKTDDGSDFLQRAWNLGDIVEHHASIVQVVNDRYSFTGAAMLVQNFFISLTVCLIAYLTKMTMNDGDLLLMVFCVIFAFIALFVNMLFNGAGLVIENMSEELLFEIYNIAWYKQSPVVRRYVCTMMCQANRLLNISYKLSVVNLGASSQVVNTAYSFFALLNSTE